MNKKVFINGIDKTNFNYRKIYGFIESFSKNYTVIHNPDDITIFSSLKQNNDIDIFFGETGQGLNIDYTNIKNVVLWANYDVRKILELSKKFKDTRFILASKSLMHNREITRDYIEKFGKHYQIYGNEGQDLVNFMNIIDSSNKLSNNSYQLTDNLFYIYLPCSLSEHGNLNFVEYDVCYFGTSYNRPRVNNALNVLSKAGFSVKTTNIQGFISPEECFNLYSKTICTISEQIHPVQLEYPVRLGESSANGCKTFLYDDLSLHREKSNLVPMYKKIENLEEVVEYISKVKRNDDLRKDIYNSHMATYDEAVSFIKSLLQ